MESIEKLIDESNQYETDAERVEHILSWFYQTIEYNYAYLFAAMMQEDINGVMEVVNSKIANGKTTYYFDGKVSGSSKLYDEIVSTYENTGSIKKIVQNTLQGHIDNEDIVRKETQVFCEMVDDDLNNPKDSTHYIQYLSINGRINEALQLIDFCEKENDLRLKRSISSVLIDYIGDENIHRKMPPVIENGILKRGVCRDYADYFADLFNKLGITSYRINGTSELEHAWVAAKIDGKWKSIDVVRAVFIRDKYKGIPSDQKASDWLINDFEKCFEMQPTRKIKSIVKNGETVYLPSELSTNNFEQSIFIDFLERNNTKKNI